MKITPKKKQDFLFLFTIQTRWSDNDIYGHVNNVVYYSYFDSAANALLIQKTGFNFHTSPIIGLVVDSSCSFFQELSYPEIIEVGVSIGKIGNTSLKYELAIFKNDQDIASAQGHFIHVFVDRKTRKSTPIRQEMRDALSLYSAQNV